MLKNFFIPFREDERFDFAEEYLKNHSYNSVSRIEKSDFILLPMVTKKNHIISDYDGLTFVGKINGETKDIIKNLNFVSYFDDETFVLKNAYATSEAVVALIEENSDETIYGADILITGFGRIGKALTKILLSMGANVTICSRSDISVAQAKFFGVPHIWYSELQKIDNKFDYIINTVEQIVFTKPEIDNMKENTIYFEIASFPGGIDKHYAEYRNLKIVDGGGLPKKYSKKSAGYFVGEMIDRQIRGE